MDFRVVDFVRNETKIFTDSDLNMEPPGNSNMALAKYTTSVNVGSAINALSLCQNSNKIVVAGRALLKIYEAEPQNQLKEIANLHMGRKQGLNMSSSDVVWSSKDENLIATAATNGAIVVWDLNAVGRNKQLAVLSDHRRTVTKISIHPKESTRLLSGSQDCTMRMFDLRKKESTGMFQSKADGVRSVEFSPFHYFMFAASFDNGSVQQIWDYRQSKTYLSQFLAHKGSVYTLNWHPDEDERNKIATGGRDNIVKVWETGTSHNKQISNIPTSTSVSAVRWRPSHKDQLATVSMMLDFSVNVWDLRRRFVPYAYFEEHNDVTTGIAWKQNDPEVLFSCSKDGTLVMHAMQDAIQPWKKIKTRGLDVGSRGLVLFAGEDSNIPARAQSPTGSGQNKLPGLFGWGVGKQDPEWAGSAPASPTTMDEIISETFVDDGFVYAAKHYLLNGPENDMSFRKLCEHNSNVAAKLGEFSVSRVWLILAEFYNSVVLLKQKMTSNFFPVPKTCSDATLDGTKRTENETKRNSVIRLQNTVVILLESLSVTFIQVEDYLTDIARGRHSEPDFYISDDENGLWGGATSDADFMYTQEWSLMGRVPTEAFEKSHIDAPSGMTNDSEAPKQKIITPHGGRWYETQTSTQDSSSPPTPTSMDQNSDPLATAFHVNVTIFTLTRYLAESGDVQTPVSILVAISSYPTNVTLEIPEAEAEHWFNSYLDLLFKHELFVQHAEVIKLSRLPSIRMLSSSSTIHTSCKVCQRRMPNSCSWSCDHRSKPDHKSPVLCFLCKKVVKTLYLYCQTCSFGGHLQCMQSW
uniref:GATOR2 complex protein WDR24 n=1 Tax=Ciona intestinalis TaxID=7719 RepID=F6WK69_CIOIN